jgi:hypothetical protein
VQAERRRRIKDPPHTLPEREGVVTLFKKLYNM